MTGDRRSVNTCEERTTTHVIGNGGGLGDVVFLEECEDPVRSLSFRGISEPSVDVRELCKEWVNEYSSITLVEHTP